MALTNTLREEDLASIEQAILQNPAAVNTADERGTTPLIAAIASSRRDVIELLLRKGADPNFTSKQSTLPLIFAIDSCLEEDDYDHRYSQMRTDVLNMLINYGADIHKIDEVEEESPYDYSKGRSFDIEQLFDNINNG